MCAVSMIGEHYVERWRPTQWPGLYHPEALPAEQIKITDAEIIEFRKLMERAREYDRENGEPDCANEEKFAELIRIADEQGVGDKVREAIGMD